MSRLAAIGAVGAVALTGTVSGATASTAMAEPGAGGSAAPGRVVEIPVDLDERSHSLSGTWGEQSGLTVSAAAESITVVLPDEAVDYLDLGSSFYYQLRIPQSSGSVRTEETRIEVAPGATSVDLAVPQDIRDAASQGDLQIQLGTTPRCDCEMPLGDHFYADSVATWDLGATDRTSTIELRSDAASPLWPTSSSRSFREQFEMSGRDTTSVSWGQTVSVTLPEGDSWLTGPDGRWSDMSVRGALNGYDLATNVRSEYVVPASDITFVSTTQVLLDLPSVAPAGFESAGDVSLNVLVHDGVLEWSPVIGTDLLVDVAHLQTFSAALTLLPAAQTTTVSEIAAGPTPHYYATGWKASEEVVPQAGPAPWVTEPQPLAVTLSTGRAEQRMVRWPTITAEQLATPGVYSISGELVLDDPAENPLGLVPESVVTISAIPAVVSVETVRATTPVGVAPVLPAQVQVAFADDQTGSRTVTWGTVSPDDYAAAGTFSVAGTAHDGGRDIPVTASVSVVAGAPVGEVSVGTISPEGTVTVTGSGFVAGEALEIWLHSAPVRLWSGTADESGAISATVQVPADTPAGAHRIEIRGAISGSVWIDLVVAARDTTGPGAPQAGRLAQTGLGGMSTAVLLSAGLVLVGLGARSVGRRRRQTTA